MSTLHYKGKPGRADGVGPGHVIYVYGDESQGQWVELEPCFDVYMHSHDGFSWGYSGSGPAQLALALCVHSLRSRFPYDVADQLALMVYQEVKWDLIANLERGRPWFLTAFVLDAVVDAFLRRGRGDE